MKLTLLIALLCSLAVAGCGGDDSGGGGGGGSQPAKQDSGPTESEWAADVTKVCKELQTDSQQVVKDVQKEGLGQRETAAESVDRSVPVVRKRLDELKAIEAPQDLQNEYDAFIGKLDATVDLFPQIADAVRANKEDPELTSKIRKAAQDTRPFALQHNLKACLPDQS